MENENRFVVTIGEYVKEVLEVSDKKDPASVEAVAELIKSVNGMFY